MIPISRNDASQKGMTRFFTGIQCRSGHVSERRTCDGKCVQCKDAILNKWLERNRERSNEIKEKYASNNIIKTKIRQKEYRKENADRLVIKRREDYKRLKAYYKEYGERWRKKNRLRLNETTRNRLRNNINARLALNMRGRIRKAMLGACPSDVTLALIGCSIDKFKSHLEKSFTEGMSFDNYGKWQVDHIVPCAIFDFTNPEDRTVCFNYRNCKPMWAGHNAAKGARLTPDIIRFSKRLRSLLLK